MHGKHAMRLQVYNFRCYRGEHAFALDDRGTTLISGSSGAGKTSLMMALFFAITGNCPPKVITDGCDTCRVTLDWDTHTSITRTRRPNRVVVAINGQTYEDDLAQSHIDRIFGKHFDCTSYVQQQYQRTFVYLSPTEKLDVLERLCFNATADLDPETLKKQCGVAQRELQHTHIETKAKMRTLEHIVRIPIDAPVCPEPFDTERLEQLQQALKRYQHELQQFEHYEYLVKRQAAVAQQLDACPEYEWTEHELTDQLFALKELKSIQCFPDVWQKHTRDECDELIRDYQRDIGYLNEHRALSASIARLETALAELDRLSAERDRVRALYEGEYACPACHADLALVNDELVPRERKRSTRANPVLTPQEKKDRLCALESQIETLQQKTQSLAHYKERCAELERYVDPQESVAVLEQDLEWIQTYVADETRKEVHNTLWTEKQQELARRVRCDWTAKQTRDAIESLRTRAQLQQQWEMYAQQLSQILSQTSVFGVNRIECVDRIRRTQLEIERTEQLRHAWELYRLKQTEYETYTARLEDIERLQCTLGLLEQRMNAVAELKQLILKTESEVIEHKIAEIAHLVNVYAEQMFATPITVQLRTLKKTQTQSEKVQIQLEVFYKNMYCDIALLSGGEQARLNLAFILAFAHVFHSPLLLLDECTSNLDQELTEIVLEHIDSVGISKVILIAHQVVEGNFAQILKLE